jgi:exonuclease III
MNIATFNVNGINGRLARVLDWLHRPSRPTSPACRS